MEYIPKIQSEILYRRPCYPSLQTVNHQRFMGKIQKSIVHAVFKLLRPLVRILLKHGISYGEFAEMAKMSFVDVAEKEFLIDGRKQSVSRVCVLTGIHRKDVNRLRERLTEQDIDLEPLSRAARVIGGWLSDSEFQTKAGHPAQLPFDGDTGSFAALVKHYSGDMPVRAVLDELKRAGTVSVTHTGKLKLSTEGYVPKKSDEQLIQVLGICTSDLLNTMSHNLNNKQSESRLQLAVAYNNLSKETVEEFKTLCERDSHHLINKYNTWLAERDRDRTGEEMKGDRCRAGLGIYYFEDDEFRNESDVDE